MIWLLFAMAVSLGIGIGLTLAEIYGWWEDSQ